MVRLLSQDTEACVKRPGDGCHITGQHLFHIELYKPTKTHTVSLEEQRVTATTRSDDIPQSLTLHDNIPGHIHQANDASAPPLRSSGAFTESCRRRSCHKPAIRMREDDVLSSLKKREGWALFPVSVLSRATDAVAGSDGFNDG